MATDNIIRSWNGKTIRQREDGYLSATDMCQACDKRWNNWERLDSTKEYLEALYNKHYSDVSNGQLIDSRVGGLPETTGTWIYRKVALRLAQWLSPEFAIQVDEWVEELMTKGKVELVKQTILELPPVDIRINQLAANLQFFDIQVTNPRFKQGFQDLIGDMLGLTKDTKALPDESVEIWLGVSERAEQLGYSSSAVIDHRVSLGIFVSKADLTKKREKRLCNGTQREINLYLQTEKLDETIHTFMLQKGVSKNA
jgi:hypothetical protein